MCGFSKRNTGHVSPCRLRPPVTRGEGDAAFSPGLGSGDSGTGRPCEQGRGRRQPQAIGASAPLPEMPPTRAVPRLRRLSQDLRAFPVRSSLWGLDGGAQARGPLGPPLCMASARGALLVHKRCSPVPEQSGLPVPPSPHTHKVGPPLGTHHRLGIIFIPFKRVIFWISIRSAGRRRWLSCDRVSPLNLCAGILTPG